MGKGNDAFSPAYESGEEYDLGQRTGEDGDYEDGNNNSLLVASGPVQK